MVNKQDEWELGKTADSLQGEIEKKREREREREREKERERERTDIGY